MRDESSRFDDGLSLQHLRDLSLEDGRAYIQEHTHKLTNHVAIGIFLAEEAGNQLFRNSSISLKLTELLIFFGEAVRHDPSHALGLAAKGRALMSVGHAQAALAFLDTAGEKFLRLGDERNWAKTRKDWMITCAWLGRPEEALQEAAHAREVFKRLGEDYLVCNIDHNTAMIYTELGRCEEACRLYKRILATYPTLADQNETSMKLAVALAQMNLAIVLAWLGNFEQAYDLQQHAQASFVSLEETSMVINSEINLAEFDYAQGYYGSALRRYYHACDSLTEHNINRPLSLASLKLWMAKCLVKLNRQHEASQLADEAVKEYRQHGASLLTSNALLEYATALLACRRFKDALAALDEAWTFIDCSRFERYALATKLLQAELLLEMGSFTEAYERAAAIREYFETQGLVSYSIRASLVMASTLLERAQEAGADGEEEQRSAMLHEAVWLCEQANRRAHRHNLQEQVYKSQSLLGRLDAIQGNFGKAAKHYQIAINHIEHILTDLVHDQYSSFLNTCWAVYEDMIALCLQQTQAERAFGYLERIRSLALRQYFSKAKTSSDERVEQGESVFPSALQKNETTLLRTQYDLRNWQERYRQYSVLLTEIDPSVSPSIDREVLQNELKACEAKISELFERLHLHQSATSLTSPISKHARRHTQCLDTAQLQEQLLPDQLLLAYFLYKGKLVIFAITKKHVITHEHPNGLAQLERLLPLLHAHLDPAGWPDLHKPPQQSIQRLLHKLYDLLVAPMEALLSLSPAYLTIVPYGPLHNLPFHALYNGSRFLIEDFQINYLPASSMLLHLKTCQIEQDVRRRERDALTQPPIVLGYSDNGHLRRIIDEAKTVAALLDGKCYLEEEATIARLAQVAPGSPIIHLATHGQRRLDAPNFSYVRLADGQLNALDAFTLNLQGCRLVTLSGCETGLALIGGGDEQLGLGRAFLAAGARSVVMSLWSVEDHATNELMQHFYQRLLSGDSRVQALRAAQCHLLQGTSPPCTHPYFWAAFRLVGEMGVLQFGREKEPLLNNRSSAPKEQPPGLLACL